MELLFVLAVTLDQVAAVVDQYCCSLWNSADAGSAASGPGQGCEAFERFRPVFDRQIQPELEKQTLRAQTVPMYRKLPTYLFFSYLVFQSVKSRSNGHRFYVPFPVYAVVVASRLAKRLV